MSVLVMVMVYADYCWCASSGSYSGSCDDGGNSGGGCGGESYQQSCYLESRCWVGTRGGYEDFLESQTVS